MKPKNERDVTTARPIELLHSDDVTAPEFRVNWLDRLGGACSVARLHG